MLCYANLQRVCDEGYRMHAREKPQLAWLSVLPSARLLGFWASPLLPLGSSGCWEARRELCTRGYQMKIQAAGYPFVLTQHWRRLLPSALRPALRCLDNTHFE